MVTRNKLNYEDSLKMSSLVTSIQHRESSRNSLLTVKYRKSVKLILSYKILIESKNPFNHLFITSYMGRLNKPVSIRGGLGHGLASDLLF